MIVKLIFQLIVKKKEINNYYERQKLELEEYKASVNKNNYIMVITYRLSDYIVDKIFAISGTPEFIKEQQQEFYINPFKYLNKKASVNMESIRSCIILSPNE